MKRNQRVPVDRPPVAIGYKYNSRKVLLFITTDESGSVGPGGTYLSGFPDNYSKVSICHVVCLLLISRYFNACNAI